MDNETIEFGTLLAKLRRGKQLSQEEVAFECRLSKNFVKPRKKQTLSKYHYVRKIC
jgi:hypothetical protein